MSTGVAASGRGALAALFSGGLAIGLAPIFVRLSELPPAATAFWRLAFAVPVLTVWMLLEQRAGEPASRVSDAARPSGAPALPAVVHPAILWRDGAGLLLAGGCFAADLAVWHWSLRYTSVANATLLPNFAPLFVTLGGWWLFRERVSWLFMLAMGVAFAGAAVLMGESFHLGPETLWGDALGLGTSVFYAGYILAVGRLRARFSTAVIMVWSGAVSAGVLLVVAVASGENLLASSLSGWLTLLGLALISHAGGQSLIAYALAHLPAAFSSLGLLIQPAAAAVLAWPLLGEVLRVQQGVGAAIILAGIFLARWGNPPAGEASSRLRQSSTGDPAAP